MAVVYINLYRSTKVEKKDKIYIKDVADISAPEHLREQINNLCVFVPEQTEAKNYVLRLVKIIDVITQAIEGIEVESVGESQALLDYNPQPHNNTKLWEYAKLSFVLLVVFSGSLVAIMAYQTDISLRGTFSILYESLTGMKTNNPVWITIPYSIGMPIGIIIFFNHFGTKKLTRDPTPIQIEIDAYEDQSDSTIIDTITNEERDQKQ